MSVAFSKQGDYFASGGQDQQVCVEEIFFLNRFFFEDTYLENEF